MKHAPSQDDVRKAISISENAAEKLVEWLHTQKIYKIDRWLKTQFSPQHIAEITGKAGLKGIGFAYGGGKWGVERLLRHTLGNIPIVSSILDVSLQLFKFAEAGFGFVTQHIYNAAKGKIEKTLAKEALDRHNLNNIQLKLVAKYTGKQGIDNILSCIKKLKQAAKDLKQIQKFETCDDYQRFQVLLAQFYWRRVRLYQEIEMLKAFLDKIQESAKECQDIYSKAKRTADNWAEQATRYRSFEDHSKCHSGFCLMNLIWHTAPGTLKRAWLKELVDFLFGFGKGNDKFPSNLTPDHPRLQKELQAYWKAKQNRQEYKAGSYMSQHDLNRFL